MKKNILILAPCPPGCGGIATWSKTMMDNRNYFDDVDLNFINVGSNKIDNMNRSFFQRIFYGVQDLFACKHKIKSILKEKNIDVFHMTVTGSLSLYRDKVLMKIAKRQNIPVVLHIRIGRIPLINRANNLEWHYLKKNLLMASKIITIDKKTYNCLKNIFTNVINIINPIDTSKIIPSDAHLNNGQITFVGWIIKEKGVEELLSAFNKLQSNGEYKLNLIGPYNKKYVDILKNRYDFKNINLYGKLSNKESLNIIKNSEIFVLPSYTEGCPNVILEAMLCKTPIIATDVGAIPEMLDDSCGIVLEPKNENQLYDSILRLINDKKMQLNFINNAYFKVVNNYSLEVIYDKYMKVWKSL